ncbi:MAC/perforin domain-containing protein [[Clostridium] polysaccharolyticum]|uniref:MAC/Perforin domain-containing protein n=1 Tax=[Clostridium] polysaccharolyticum TaxID=29364 RepID=A0A1I0B273_9FIRM|nr:MAC/perforin domain-containing protein [[Clostridium] polysaccharolyticum]SET00167.1 MAC/Perforin domain-containing protein [[Clostridium] polysaccharolyticum]
MEKDDFKRYLYYGFDKVENPYAKTQEIKQVPILDKEKITELSGKSWYESLPGINQVDYKIIISQTESELEQRSVAECGSGYQGTESEFWIKQSLDYSQCNFISELYGKVISNCLQAQIVTKLDLEALKKCTTGDFIEAVQKGDMEKVFETYGTHLISHVLIGGRMVIPFCTKKNTQRTVREIKTLAEESYKAFVANENITYSHSQVEFSQFCEYSIWAIGGNVSYLPTQFGKNKEYHKWVESLEFQPALYQVTNCIPIWELVSEEETKKALKKAYFLYLFAYRDPLYMKIDNQIQENKEKMLKI